MSIVRGGPKHRIAMIPLILSPHDWRILDNNVAITSTRYAVQPSCEGLYGRYESLDENAPAAWFAAVRSDGVFVGLASARCISSEMFCVDAFAHGQHEDTCLKPLYQQAILWARQQDGEAIHTTCARTDHSKKAALRKHLIDESPDIRFVDQ